LIKITHLRDDQFYESWLWDDLFLEWNGSNFAIIAGKSNEMVTTSDTFVTFVGSNEPAGLVSLNENPAATDKNWVSIPYNAVYGTVSDITSEYSPGGDPLVKIANLRDDQFFESWLWDDLFMEWNGTDFVVEPGRGYEFVTIVDTTWNPTEYANQAKTSTGWRATHMRTVEMKVGSSTAVTRWPVWHTANGVWQMANRESQKSKDKRQSALGVKRHASPVERDASSLVVRSHFELHDGEGVVFTAYRPDNPHDVLTEQMVGSGVAQKGDMAALWFDAGNFTTPWQDGEEVLVIVEALQDDEAYCNVVSIELNETVDIQELGMIELAPLAGVLYNNEHTIGFSEYRDNIRSSHQLQAISDLPSAAAGTIRPVIRGGFETVYSTDGAQSNPDKQAPLSYAFSITPNPTRQIAVIEYAIPQQTQVNIAIYDVTGRLVKTLVSKTVDPGYYSVAWDRRDTNERTIPSGIYFLEIATQDYRETEKLILVK
jgi:hypothetical protein